MQKKISLYDIADEVYAFGELLMIDHGELSEESQDLEKHIQELLTTKTDSIVNFVQKLKDEITIGKEHKERIETYMRVRANTVSRLEEMCFDAMERMEVKKLRGSMCDISARKRTMKVEIVDEDKLPTQFVELTAKVKSADIKKALSNNEVVPGATLTQGKKSVGFKLKSVK